MSLRCQHNQTRISHARAGFTLIEVLIAMAIFAVLSLLAYGGLNAVMENKEQTAEALQRLQQLQLTMTHLHRDIEQITPREARDELGGKLLSLASGNSSELLIEFTRNGWRNPAGLPRSHLQRVAYRLDDDQLIRISWPYIDRAQDSQAIELPLINNVKDVSLRFYDGKSWHTSWPDALADSSANTNQALPRAIEVTLQLHDWGDIVRLLRVP